jgi:hypothetical protein
MINEIENTVSSVRPEDQIKFNFKDDGDIFVIVPKNLKSSDYGFAVGKVLRTLSQMERRNESEILRNIISPNVDVMKFRFLGAGVDGTSLPLSYAMNAVTTIRDALIFSACSEFNQRPSFGRQLKGAVDVIDKTRFGQTQQGSFVIAVEMALEMPVVVKQNAQQASLTTVSPIQRRVISRILKGVDKARKVALSNEQVDADNDFKSGLNTNLAEALAALQSNDHDLSVELSAQWDKSIAVAQDVPTAPIVLESRTFESLISIGHILRGSVTSRSVSFSGRVVSLSRDDSENDEFEADHTITIKTDGDDLPKNIKVILSPEDYLKACDWHKEKKAILISGTLEKPRKSWCITGYEHFIART